MTYEEARIWIDQTNQYGSKLGLDTITELLRRLGNPQDRLKIIHVAGTNGKGSTTAFLSSVLAAQGYLVGRYISPAVFTYCERIQLAEKSYDGITVRYISEAAVAETIGQIRPLCEAMVHDGFAHPTSFEIETAMAFLYLYQENVDYAVIEVGLGGRLDATNVMKKPLLCVITTISMDHMQYLGDTIAKIALEKAGIIKDNTPVVTSNSDPQVLAVLKKVCEERGSAITIADPAELTDIQYSPEDTSFFYKSVRYRIRLLGGYQTTNAILALKAVDVLRNQGIVISEEAIRNGMRFAVWRGRFEIMRRDPFFIIDGAHNEDAARQLRRTLELYFSGRRIIFIMGVLADKDYPEILRITAGLADVIYTITPNNVRGLPSGDLAAEAIKHGPGRVVDAHTVRNAIHSTYQEAGKDDIIIAFGSLSYLSEVTEILNHTINEYDRNT